MGIWRSTEWYSCSNLSPVSTSFPACLWTPTSKPIFDKRKCAILENSLKNQAKKDQQNSQWALQHLEVGGFSLAALMTLKVVYGVQLLVETSFALSESVCIDNARSHSSHDHLLFQKHSLQSCLGFDRFCTPKNNFKLTGRRWNDTECP